ncbi:hypothetical protein KIW84_015062 [Lathyrus oleraceus]|uniref:Uncharacterized protein n=1 Tax=Pisum sativum TaxID=3888 RepID=A0A9D5BPS6_PEA|nr:hypothetical protein KIW84_015062 [Pisum sativum]
MKELWKVDVKVHHKWSVVSKNKEHFEMIVIDKDCPKVARGDKAPLLCEVGHSTEAGIFRYKIENEVSHYGKCKCSKFVFCERLCSQLFGVSAAQMHDIMIKAGIDDPLEFPLALDVLLGSKIAFKVKCQLSWKSCYVVMILRDESFTKGSMEKKPDIYSPT